MSWFIQLAVIRVCLSAPVMKAFIDGRLWWFVTLGCAAAIFIAFAVIDLPLAQLMFAAPRHLNGVQRHLGGDDLMMIEAGLFCGSCVIGLIQGAMTPLTKAIAVACATSIGAYLLNDSFLKVAFGIPNPSDVVRGAQHSIHWFAGSSFSSFPSGHMILCSSFAGAFIQFYRASFWPLAALLFFGATLLVVGDWHFLSDVIAGIFVGFSVGLAVARLWTRNTDSEWAGSRADG